MVGEGLEAADRITPTPTTICWLNLTTRYHGAIVSLLSALSLASGFASTVAQAEVTGAGFPSLKQPITTKALEGLINRKNLLVHAEQLLKFSELSNGARAFGSEGHEATIHYAFTSTSKLTVDGQDVWTSTFTYAPGGDVTAPIALVANEGCQASDYPVLTNKVAQVYIKRGNRDFGLKIAFAGGAGAGGAIIYNNVDGRPTGGTLAQPTRPEGPYVPSAYITTADAARFIEKVNAGTEVSAAIHATVINEDRVAAIMSLWREHIPTLSLLDPLNDDGSGTIGILRLEVALNFAKFRGPKNAVRFAWWSDEDSPRRNAKKSLYLNFDVIAFPNSGYFVFDGDGNATNIPGPRGARSSRARAGRTSTRILLRRGVRCLEEAVIGTFVSVLKGLYGQAISRSQQKAYLHPSWYRVGQFAHHFYLSADSMQLCLRTAHDGHRRGTLGPRCRTVRP
ncbi:hypothetical protein DFP72DRAFT_1046923 [Ephemerocybe angulata]|uniref:PA domain-containing protein n=1 Tax=Ephemerocybe angulata TaxID=980116 RepID=A0A8H6HTY1_9AGAR|nr:hypothetical protein DFP72DRAFT_1046923 [Tulosesus angulatus]